MLTVGDIRVRFSFDPWCVNDEDLARLIRDASRLLTARSPLVVAYGAAIVDACMEEIRQRARAREPSEVSRESEDIFAGMIQGSEP